MRQWFGGGGKNFALAVRGLVRNPGFTLVAVVTLALGMGGSAAIYTMLDRVVLDPLPYPQADRLVRVENQVPGVAPDAVWQMSTAQYVYFTEHATTLESVGLFRGEGALIETPAGPERTFGWRVTASMFPLLGARARVGRIITPDDDRPGGPNVVVLSHGFWQRLYGGDRNAIGTTLSIFGTPFEIIGVLEPDARMPGSSPTLPADLWFPMQIDPNGNFGNNHVFRMIARLLPGVDIATSEAEIERLKAGLPERFPRAYRQQFFDQYGFRTQMTSLKESIVGEMSRNLWILFGAVGLVLLIAAANVANLFLVRLEARRRELAIRSALGASMAAIARYMLAESLVLSIAGGTLGLFVAFLGVPALVAMAPGILPRADSLHMDGGTVVFTVVLSLVVSLGLAIYPLTRRTQHTDASLLAAGGDRGGSVGRERQRVRSVLVVTQVALALTLLVGAGLLLESLQRLNRLDPGVEPEGVVTAGIYLLPNKYQSDVTIWETYRQILEGIRALPGVTDAGMSGEIPVDGGFGCTIQGFEDLTVYERVRAAGMTTCAGQEPTTPGYFESLGIPVLMGRSFTTEDNDNPARASAIVSRAFAERFWPGEDPIGKGLAPNGRSSGPFYHVIGVVGDVPAGSIDGEPAIAVYYPITQNPNVPGNWWWSPTALELTVKTERADALSIFPEIRRVVQSVDPSIPLANARSMYEIIANSTARYRFISLLLGIAASIAVILASVGLYGVVSYVVSRRTREIGMRIAIGARPGTVERLFVMRSLALVAVGLAVGVGLALATTRVMSGLLFGVAPTDPATFIGAAAILAVVAVLASWIPARRAARVDPVTALRAE